MEITQDFLQAKNFKYTASDNGNLTNAISHVLTNTLQLVSASSNPLSFTNTAISLFEEEKSMKTKISRITTNGGNGANSFFESEKQEAIWQNLQLIINSSARKPIEIEVQNSIMNYYDVLLKTGAKYMKFYNTFSSLKAALDETKNIFNESTTLRTYIKASATIDNTIFNAKIEIERIFQNGTFIKEIE